MPFNLKIALDLTPISCVFEVSDWTQLAVSGRLVFHLQSRICMYLSQVESIGFRNLSGHLFGDAGVNILWGQNGHGKTSWLEVIALLGNTKSFRTHQLSEAINFHETAARAIAQVIHKSRTITLEVHLKGSQKQLLVNGKRVPVSEYLGILDVFVYCREELSIVRGEPSERRRFLDRGVLSLKPGYVQTLADYNRVLKQKNALLKSIEETVPPPSEIFEMLDVWNAQLVEYGTQIHKARTAYVERLNQTLERRFFGAEAMTVRYRSSLEGKGDLTHYPNLLAERLRVRREAELAAGHALIGPHRDDLDILTDGREVARFGSAGQQRSALLVLELAQLTMYHQEHDDFPVFLLDDIDAELDRDRIRTVLDFLQGKAQVFVTTSKAALAEEYRQRARLSQILSGTVVLQPEKALNAEF